MKPPDDGNARYQVGDHVRVNMHTGAIIDATIRALIERTDGVHLQIDFGKDQTALIHESRVIK